MNSFKQFADRFNKSDDAKPSPQIEIDTLEYKFNIHLPNDYKSFLLSFGNIWTPEILDLVVDQESEMNDVQDFWGIDKIIYDKENEWTSQIATDVIPFASDCMGNIFVFLTNDIKSPAEAANIYFYDHDFDTIEIIATSFKDWIDNFNAL